MRFLSLFLCFLLILSSFSVFAAEGEGEDTPAAVLPTESETDAALVSAVRGALAEEEVTCAYRLGVLYTSLSERSTPTGIALPLQGEETPLSFGDRVKVLSDDTYLKLYTVAEVSVRVTENGEEHVKTEQRRFEWKTVYFSRGSEFVLQKNADGVALFLERGSLSYAYASDPFGNGSFSLATRDVSVAAGESYVVLGASEEGSALYRLGGIRPLFFSACETLSEGSLEDLGGVFVDRDGKQSEWEAPLFEGVEESKYAPLVSSLPWAMKENSALQAGASQAAKRTDPNSEAELIAVLLREALLDDFYAKARAYTTDSLAPHPLCMSVDDFLTKDFLAPLFEESRETHWNLRLPTSSAAYTVKNSGELVNLSKLSSEQFVEVSLSLAVPLSDAEDRLELVFGEKSFPISHTEGTDTYVFRLPVSTLKKAYGKDVSERALSVAYSTADTHLFWLTETAAYRAAADAAQGIPEEGKPYTVTVELKKPLRDGDELYLLLSNGTEEAERIAPTAAVGQENTYLFTVVPKKGANFAEIVVDTVCELRVKNGLCGAYSYVLEGSVDGFVTSLMRPSLVLYPAHESDFVPVVLQSDGNVTHALTPDAYGRYCAYEIGGDTTFSLSLGYPVYLPAENELYSVEPEEGFAADYAEAGGEYRFKVSLSREAALGTSILVKNNGVTLSPNSEGVYIIAEVTQPVRLTLTSGVTYSIFLPSGENFTVLPYGGDGTTVLENGTFRFTLQTAEGTDLSGLIVAANESVLKPDSSGIYTVSGITRDVYITVRLVASFRVVLPMGDGYVAAPVVSDEPPQAEGTDPNLVPAGGEYRFTVHTAEDVHPKSVLTVLANGEPLAPEKDGTFVVSDVRSDVVVSVHLKNAFAVTLPESAEGCSVSAEQDFVLYGEDFTFTVKSDGTAPISVYVNGRKLSSESDRYTVKNVRSELYITVSVAAESEVRHSVFLSSFGVISAEALTEGEVSDGGTFAFTVTLPQELGAEDVVVAASSGTLTLKGEEVSGETRVLTYELTGIHKSCNVSVFPKAEG